MFFFCKNKPGSLPQKLIFMRVLEVKIIIFSRSVPQNAVKNLQILLSALREILPSEGRSTVKAMLFLITTTILYRLKL